MKKIKTAIKTQNPTAVTLLYFIPILFWHTHIVVNKLVDVLLCIDVLLFPLIEFWEKLWLQFLENLNLGTGGMTSGLHICKAGILPWTMLTFFFGGCRTGLASFLLDKHFITWATHMALFMFIFLKESSFCPGPASDWDPPTYASLIAGITDYGWLVCWDGVWPTFF
jgi:hypothetical protein